MEETQNSFSKLAIILDQNIRGVQIGVYTIALSGLAIALRTIRPFSKFKKASDVPKQFFESRTKLKGVVERIEAGRGGLLMVQHRPLIQLIPRRWSADECLVVKVAGIDVSPNGISWLQTVVSGHPVVFVPVARHHDWLACEVTLLQKRIADRSEMLEVGPALVRVGLGTVSADSSEAAPRYVQQLAAAEQAALRSRLGSRYYLHQSTELVHRLLSVFRTRLSTTVARRAPAPPPP